MPRNVTLTHPRLPGRSITVRADSVPHYKRAGWRTRTAPVQIRKPDPDPADVKPADTKEH